MAVVDFLGFRMIAMTLLPIDQSTLLVGTDDALRTHYRCDPVLIFLNHDDVYFE